MSFSAFQFHPALLFSRQLKQNPEKASALANPMQFYSTVLPSRWQEEPVPDISKSHPTSRRHEPEKVGDNQRAEGQAFGLQPANTRRNSTETTGGERSEEIQYGSEA